MISCLAVLIYATGEFYEYIFRARSSSFHTYIGRQILKIFCSVLAAKNLSDMAYDNFLDHTFLGDRRTTIREYLATSGSGIMEEEPPEDLKHRYGGWHEQTPGDICWQVSIFLSNLLGLEPVGMEYEDCFFYFDCYDCWRSAHVLPGTLSRELFKLMSLSCTYILFKISMKIEYVLWEFLTWSL